MEKEILKGVDCDYIDQICNAWGVMEPICTKKIYNICCTECSYNRLSKKNEKYKGFIDKFNKLE